ncbi:penicillin-insensitive murein endopeptidase [Pararhizobium mangrovi]|uniref:Penicillin-insensitive murein endopeptidase n=1 Tax=Pararhizobium mangrovi TaxID=2590452 RepID=A0A506U0E2_9HYPH|nr:penicillin-insensitive murein endopeptidase [Pararhizobium mangrovi]TPW26435.1 penicillin-insensitive murein endopeptidase [Pararhizobium mangrovi]
MLKSFAVRALAPAAYALLALGLMAGPSAAAGRETAAKTLFGAKKLPAALQSDSIGSYAKGCLAGAVALPLTGPTWQVVHPARNRNWGNPRLIAFLEKFSREAAAKDGWRGLLVGDISQPRGGPMVDGHASHQIGLDADIWLTPMPNRVLSTRERNNIEFDSMVQAKNHLELDRSHWSNAQARLIMRAASEPEVQRIFVHPPIKRELCRIWKGDRSILGKVRPYWHHDAHMHVRLRCPPGDDKCKPQAKIPPGDGCGKQLAWWFTDEPWRPAKPSAKPATPHYTTLADLPVACRAVLQAPAVSSRGAAIYRGSADATPSLASAEESVASVPVPRPRPDMR